MYKYGELAVHNNVTFEANTAGSRGGAVSLPFDGGLGFRV
jgi:predicted outer membrane repeat protein